MAAAWDLADGTLVDQLQAYLDSLSGTSWSVHLFSNDYVPVPGTDNGNFTEATFPGYSPQPLSAIDFGPASVSDHIASSVSSSVLSFVADASGFSSETIYGYWITDTFSAYVLSERFAAPLTILPSGTIEVTPRLRQRTCNE